MTELVINFDEFRERQMVIDHLRNLHGMMKVTICKYRKGRTNPQLRYYFAAIVTPFSDWLRDQDAYASKEAAHEILKAKFLAREVISEKTGEVIKSPGSTGDLNTEEMGLYIEQCSAFLWDFCGITVQPAKTYAMT